MTAALTPHPRDTALPLWVADAHRRDARDLVFSVDGGRLITIGDDAPIHVWNAYTGACERSLPGHRPGGEALAVHPDGRRLYSAGRDNVVRVWDLDTGEALGVLQGHTDKVTAVAISPDGAFAASGSADRTTRLWDVASGACLSTWTGHAEPVSIVTFTDLGGFPWLWSGCASGVFLGGPAGAARPRIKETGDRIIARDPHNDRIIARSSFHDAREAPQAAVRLFGPDGIGPPESRLTGHLGEVRCATFTPAGVALTGSADRGLRRFAIDGTLASHLRAGGAGCDVMAVHPDHELVAIGDADGRVLVFDGATVFDEVFEAAHSHGISAVGHDGAGRPWSLGRDGFLVIRGPDLKPVIRHCLRRVESMHNSAGIIDGAWWRHGPLALSSTRARGIQRWEVVNAPSVEQDRTLDESSPDRAACGTQRIAVTVLDRSLRLLDAESLDDVARIELAGYPTAVAIGPGDVVVVGCDKGELTRCDAEGCGIERQPIEGGISALTFADDGALYVGGRTGALRVIRGATTGEATPGHAGAIVAIAVCGSGPDALVFTAGADRQVIARRGPVEVQRWTLPVPPTALAPCPGGAIYGDAAGAMGRLVPDR